MLNLFHSYELLRYNHLMDLSRNSLINFSTHIFNFLLFCAVESIPRLVYIYASSLRSSSTFLVTDQVLYPCIFLILSSVIIFYFSILYKATVNACLRISISFCIIISLLLHFCLFIFSIYNVASISSSCK